MNDLLPSYGLTSCDTVTVCYSIGKLKITKALKTGKYPLDTLGYISSSVEEVMKQARAFILDCFGAPVSQKLDRKYCQPNYVLLLKLSCKMHSGPICR